MYQQIQAHLQAIFTFAGLVWASGVGYQTILDAISHHPIRTEADVIKLAGTIIYSYGQYRSALNEHAKINGLPQVHTSVQHQTIIMIFIGLILTQLVDAVEKAGWLGPNQSNTVRPNGQPGTNRATPAPAPASTPTPAPTPTPKTTPASAAPHPAGRKP
jgi:hypothetical protein